MGRKSSGVVGERFGDSSQVEAIRNTGMDQKWEVKCHVCAEDWELYGEGIFYATLTNLRKGYLPCGCASHTVHNLEQHRVLIDRCLEGSDKRFIKFLGEFKGVDTRLLVQCKIDGYDWEITIDNLVRGKGCPHCMVKTISDNFKKSDSVMVDGFLKSGRFVKGTTFNRSDRKSKAGYPIWWKVYCPICDDTFESRSGNLRQGHLPCRCPKTGFNKNEDSFVYVIRAVSGNSEFTGYGISGNIEQRLKTHRRNLTAAGFIMSECERFPMKGVEAQKLEQLIRNRFERFPQAMSGFKYEATHYHLFQEVIQFIENYIEGNNE